MDIRNVLMAISLALSVLIGLVLSRGGRDGASAASGPGERVLIGLSLDTLKEARWVADRDLFIARCNQLGADVRYNAANSDDSQQTRDIQALITARVKVLVIVPHDGRAMGAMADAAKAAGIPVISYDRLITHGDVDLYLSFDNVRVGRQQAQFLVDHLPAPGHGNVVRIYGSHTDHNALLFKQGQDEVLAPYIKSGDIKVVLEDWAEDWKPENAKRIMDGAVTRKLAFDAVLASNDGTAGGAIQTLREAGLAGKVLVTGQDAEVAACQRIADGSQTMTIYKPLKHLATLAAETAVAMAKGRPVIADGTVDNDKEQVPSVLADTVAVTKENLLDVIVKGGFHTYEEVYGGLPADQRPPKP